MRSENDTRSISRRDKLCDEWAHDNLNALGNYKWMKIWIDLLHSFLFDLFLDKYGILVNDVFFRMGHGEAGASKYTWVRCRGQVGRKYNSQSKTREKMWEESAKMRKTQPDVNQARWRWVASPKGCFWKFEVIVCQDQQLCSIMNILVGLVHLVHGWAHQLCQVTWFLFASQICQS